MPGRPIGSSERKIPSGVGVRYLYQPGELEGGRRRANRPCVVPRGVLTWALGHQAQRACPILSSRWASPWVRPGRAARCARRHSVASRWGSHSGRISTMSARAAPHLGGDGIFVAVGQCGDTVFCDPALWSRRGTTRPYSSAGRICGDLLIAACPYHGGRSSCRRGPLCTASCRMCFFMTFFFTPFAFLMFFPPASKIEYILGRRPAYSAMGRPAHSSFILPKTFLFAVLWRKCFCE